ncbi:MAG: winged helix-turn-helix domain-containing protein [Oscillospiraceae bacterium]|nr:winged helix-turn-helix domain-containing protein [Oscillospiraceae bacterium]
MERNLENEIDELKNQLKEIKELLISRKEPKIGEWNPENEKKIDDVREWAKETNNELGAMFYYGFFSREHYGAKWDLRDGINDLMNMPQEKLSVVLSSLGNQQRWEILCALLKKPMTVAQIMEEFDMKTSGKAYHHLKSLIAADLLEEVKDKDVEKGSYSVKGHRVAGIILVLTGVQKLTDTVYSSGEWNLE